MGPMLGQVIMFAGNFAPRGWALCDGQLMSVPHYSALFSLLGTAYGGDGRTTFALPDLRGCSPMHAGTGTGLSPRALGQSLGHETVALTASDPTPHDHGLHVPNAATMGLGATLDARAGDGQSHDNLPPVLVINHIIALEGVYPSRN